MLTAASLEYETRGTGEAVLFIHGGFVCDAHLPLMSQPALAAYRLIRYRRRGYGSSAKHSGPVTIGGHSRDALTLLQALGVERAHVVGHSYGGLVAMQLAVDAPATVCSLVLCEPALGIALNARKGGPQPPFIARATERLAAGDPAGAVDGFLGTISGPNWRTEVSELIPGAAEQAEQDATVIEAEHPSLATWTFDALTAKQIFQPVLLLQGMDRERGQMEGRKLLHDWLPQTEDCDVPGANHFLQFHNRHSATLVAEGIAAFLQKHISVETGPREPW